MKRVTLCVVYRPGGEPEVLLGMKKRGFGVGKWNGFGGKIEPNESVRQAAVRELREECGLQADPEALEDRGTLRFRFPHHPEFDHFVHVFLTSRWRGEPVETPEMRAAWHPLRDLPFHDMWDDDRYWLPLILAGKRIEAEFTYNADNETVDIASIRLQGEP